MSTKSGLAITSRYKLKGSILKGSGVTKQPAQLQSITTQNKTVSSFLTINYKQFAALW